MWIRQVEKFENIFSFCITTQQPTFTVGHNCKVRPPLHSCSCWELELRTRRNLLFGGVPHTCACSLKSILLTSSQLEHSTGLTMLRWIPSGMTLTSSQLKSQGQELLVCESQANGLSSILWLVMNAQLTCHDCFFVYYHSVHLSPWAWPLYTCWNYFELEDWWSSQ